METKNVVELMRQYFLNKKKIQELKNERKIFKYENYCDSYLYNKKLNEFYEKIHKIGYENVSIILRVRNIVLKKEKIIKIKTKKFYDINGKEIVDGSIIHNPADRDLRHEVKMIDSVLCFRAKNQNEEWSILDERYGTEKFWVIVE